MPKTTHKHDSIWVPIVDSCRRRGLRQFPREIEYFGSHHNSPPPVRSPALARRRSTQLHKIYVDDGNHMMVRRPMRGVCCAARGVFSRNSQIPVDGVVGSSQERPEVVRLPPQPTASCPITGSPTSTVQHPRRCRQSHGGEAANEGCVVCREKANECNLSDGTRNFSIQRLCHDFGSFILI